MSIRRPFATCLLSLVSVVFVVGCDSDPPSTSPQADSGSRGTDEASSEGNASGGRVANPAAEVGATVEAGQSDSRPTVSLAQARRAFDAGDVDKAYATTKSYLISNPDDAEALFLAAQCLFQMQQDEQAVAMLEEIKPDNPRFGMDALGQAADWYMANGKPAEAERMFRTLIQYHGDVPLAHSRLALLMNSQGRRFDAKEHLMALAKAEDITRRELGALVVISEQSPVAKVPGTTGQDGKLVPGDLRVVRQQNLSGDLNESIQLGEKLWKAFPDHGPIAAFMGKAYMDVQDFQRLEDWFARLPDSARKYPLFWSTMARWMASIERHQEAVYCASIAVRMDPTDHVAYQTLSRSLRTLGEQDAAIMAEQRGEQLVRLRKLYWETVDSEPTAEQLAQIAGYMIDLNRPYESLGWLRQAAKIDPSAPGIAQVSQRLRSYKPPADYQGWILCGLDLNKYPEPDFSIVASETRLRIGQPSDPPSEQGETTIVLNDVAAEVGLDFNYNSGNPRSDGSYLLLHTMGGGIGVIDFDLDGWPDAYFSQGGGTAFEEDNAPNVLYRNLSGQRFIDVASRAGVEDNRYGQGVSAADFNQDGFSDLVVANIGRNTFYRNNGDGTFSEVEVPQWNDRDYWTSQIAVADLTGNGLVDLVECNYIDDPTALTTYCTKTQQLCAPARFQPSSNRVLVGRKDGGFQPHSTGAEMESLPRFSLGVVVGNIDDALGNDVFIANDTVENELWINQPLQDSDQADGLRLSEQSRLRGCATGPLGDLQGCMGIAVGDFDHNGTFDMYVTNYFNQASNLFMQQSGGMFVDQVRAYSAYQSSVPKVGFGTQAADLDHDGWLDLVVLNGHAVDRRELGEPLEMPPQLYRGKRGSFALVSQQDPFWTKPTLGRTLAMLDWNRDGKTDFLANHLDVPATLLENRSTVQHAVQIELVGTTSERDATGSKISVRCGDQTRVFWITAGDGYFCTNESMLQVGVDSAGQIDELTVDWPSGLTQTHRDLKTDSRYLLVEGIDTPHLRQRW